MNGVRALIVDDSSVMRKIVERSLRQAGVNLTQVFESATGQRRCLCSRKTGSI